MSSTPAISVQAKPVFDLSPQTFEQALTFSQYLADSDMVPKDFKGKPGNCLIAMQWGAEIGLKPLQALQGIAVINGRPSLWGDALLAIVRASPLCESVQEGWGQDGSAFCRVKRRGEQEQIRTFSDADAKLAGLLGKQGPWLTSPKRMKQLRARAFALRDVFADVLKGMAMAEELQDYPSGSLPQEPKAIDPDTGEIKPKELPAYPDEAFSKNLGTWQGLIEAGKKTADQIIAMVSSKATLSEDQIYMIHAAQVVDTNTIDME
jgi:hypothetical protein